MILLKYHTYMSKGGGNTVTASVTASNDNHVLACGIEGLIVDLVTTLFLLPRLEELHRKVNTLQVTS